MTNTRICSGIWRCIRRLVMSSKTLVAYEKCAGPQAAAVSEGVCG
jgi:hypothetical protein